MPDIPGFTTDSNGSLLVTTDVTGAVWDTGFLRAPTGELVVTTDTGSWDTGFLRNNGVLCVQEATGEWSEGFVRTPSGALAVTTVQGDLHTGFYRASTGELAVTGLTAPVVYEESFDVDEGGWFPLDTDTLSRDTVSYQSAPASLKCVNPGSGTGGAVSAFFAVSGDVKGEIWVRSPDSTSAIGVLYTQIDGSDNPVGQDIAGEGTATLSSSWQKITFTGAKDGQPKGAIVVSLPDYNQTLFIDTVKVELQ